MRGNEHRVLASTWFRNELLATAEWRVGGRECRRASNSERACTQEKTTKLERNTTVTVHGFLDIQATF